MKQATNNPALRSRAQLAPVFAWSIGTLCFVLVIAGLLFYGLNHATPGVVEKFYPTEPVGGIAFAVLGVLVVARLPNHRVGWLFLVIGLSAALALFTDQYTIYKLVTHPAGQPFVWLVVWLHTWVWLVGNWAIGLLLLIFPTGRLLSARWRWASWLLAGSTGAFAGLVLVVTWGMTAQQMRQFDGSQLSPLLQTLSNGFILAMFVSYAVAALSLLARLQRARGVERQQLKWFTFAVTLLVLTILLANLAQELWSTPALDTLSKLIQALALAGMAVAVGLAILQHQLFDIDIIIRRTLVYTLLTGLLGLIYFSCVVILQGLVRPFTGADQSPVATASSTLAIIVLFAPLRHRIQALIDRRFYRRKYDAEQVLATFGETVRNETDLDHLTSALLTVVQETMQPTHVSLWLGKPANDARQQR
ncbi:MAG: hypothetical protein U0350_06565 [Caldilineaceae bacterium]